MKKILGLIIITMMLSACKNKTQKEMNGSNPLLEAFKTPHEVPPFELIKNEHFEPAFMAAIEKHKAEIDSIANNPAAPTFENTLVALDQSGQQLEIVGNIFDNLKEANTNDTIDSIALKISPILTKHYDEINLNEKLFQRIKTVYDAKATLQLNTEQNRMLDLTYSQFVRGGANLPAEKKTRLKEINSLLSTYSITFGDHVLADNNAFKLYVDKKEELDGLPEAMITTAAEEAEKDNNKGKFLFTVDKSCLLPFITYCKNRDLREKLFKGYITRGDLNNGNDNKKIISEVIKLRTEKAQMLGYKTYADFVLEQNMAKNSQNVFSLLNQVWAKALPAAKKEAIELQKMIDKEGGKFKLQPWDWWFYSEKLRKEKYDLDEETIRPYFQLENVRQGMFTVANKLYGITFEKRSDIPLYQADVEVYEAKEANGSHIGILYMDYYPRKSKRGGAWCTEFRQQSKLGDKNITPVISIVCNFTPATKDKPSLLTFDEASTLFHEFGHALQGLLSNCTYNKTSSFIPRDFVELPSQIMENWAADPEVLKIYAKHYKSGESIPDELIKKIENSSHFNMGFTATEFLAAAFLDMDWHSLTEVKDWNVIDFESASMKKIGLIPEIVVRYRSTYFNHVFSGGYATGYYGYTWSEVLDADAFQAFKETSLFDQKTATAFRKNVLEKGGSDDPVLMYRAFRGKDPSVDPMLRRKGFL